MPSSAATVVSAEYGDEGHYNDHICWETVIGQVGGEFFVVNNNLILFKEIVKLVTMVRTLFLEFLTFYLVNIGVFGKLNIK